MNMPEIASNAEDKTVQTGCCGSAAPQDHAAASLGVPHDHGSHTAPATGSAAKAADKQKPGHASGCCCS